jgi:hypothetical protein
MKRLFGDKQLKKLTLIAAVFALCFLGGTAFGQGIDVGFGYSTLLAPAANTSNGLFFPSLRGGGYPSFSADFLLKNRLGLEGEISWRASQDLYGGNQPFRPVLWDINAIWAPRLSKNLTAEVVGGIGAEDLRFYGIVNCSYFVGCTNYSSSNHFNVDVGAGLRFYVWHGVFLRPELREYFIHNNQEFSSGRATRVGATLGYSFGK